MFILVERTDDRVARANGFMSIDHMIETLRSFNLRSYYLVSYEDEKESIPEHYTPGEITIYSFTSAGPRQYGYRVYTEKCTGWLSPDRKQAYVTKDCTDKVM